MSPEELEKLVSSMPSSTFFKLLKTISWLPENEWETRVKALHKRYPPEEGFTEEEALEIFRSSSFMMAAIRMKWGRYVQPTRPLDDLAPIIGAIKSGDHGAKEAALHFSNAILKAIAEDDAEFLSRVKKISRVQPGQHPNFEVWNVISEMISTNAFKPAKWVEKMTHCAIRKSFEKAGIPIPDPMPSLWAYPDTKEVRDFVEQHPSDFPLLSELHDDTEWGRVWRASGAEFIIVKGRRRPKP